MSEQPTTCNGCRYFRKGRCSDWTVGALLGGENLKDGENRKCWEPLNEENELDEGAEAQGSQS